MRTSIISSIEANISVKRQFSDSLIDTIARVSQKCVDALRDGNKILACGNGGSASDSQHFVTELVCRFQKNRRALPAIALPSNDALLTAIANDFNYTEIYSRQVEALGQKGDILFALSTSGNSPNVLRAIETARAKGVVVVGFTGIPGGKIHNLCDELIAIPSNETARIQESHILILHIISDLIENAFIKN